MSGFPDTPAKLLRTMAERPVSEDEEYAWAQFVELYTPTIRAFVAMAGVQPDDVDDVTQDVFVRLVGIMRRDGYDSSRGRFRTYLRTIMRRTLIDRFRRQSADRAQLHEPLDEDEMQADASLPQTGAALPPNAADAFEEKWRRAQYRALLDHVFSQTAISDQNREIYRAYVLDGDDAGAVAARFGVTPEVVRQVKSRVNRMIAALARRLEG
jgi:RNA polymerase sigma-70 factor (ECF subfamily)